MHLKTTGGDEKLTPVNLRFAQLTCSQLTGAFLLIAFVNFQGTAATSINIAIKRKGRLIRSCRSIDCECPSDFSAVNALPPVLWATGPLAMAHRASALGGSC
jgi:hypothetical protein